MADRAGPQTFSPVSQGYWEGVSRNELVVQCCDDCSRLRHYPQYLCPRCQSSRFTHLSIEKTGTVHSWTVCAHSFDMEIAPDTPYSLVTVDIQEGVRLLGRYEGTEPLRIGLPVELVFEANHRGNLIPVFRNP